jgi:hypothetical protein
VLTVHAKVAERIFRQSGTSDINGARIGKYSQGYRRLRAKKGKINTQNINLTFTGQMKEDFTVITLPTTLGKFKFGSGFKNSKNFDKSNWVEETYDKQDKIFALSEEEEKLFYNLTDKYIKKMLS